MREKKLIPFRLRGPVTVLLLVAVLGGVGLAAGQRRYWSGQTVAPVFEGWERNEDGTFNFVFGYFNRNHEETLDIPIGPDNNLAPGEPDQGQPTFFAPLRQKVVFRVKVPADWGPTKRLVWTLTIRGKTEKANAFLLPEWETNAQAMGGNAGPGQGSAAGGDPDNKAPAITVAPDRTTIALRETVAITASVADDGRPKPSRGRDRRRVGVLRVDWLQYRGPVGGRAVFTPAESPVSAGRAVTTATFSAPGQYVLRAFGNDGELRGTADVIVTVTPSS